MLRALWMASLVLVLGNVASAQQSAREEAAASERDSGETEAQPAPDAAAPAEPATAPEEQHGEERPDAPAEEEEEYYQLPPPAPADEAGAPAPAAAPAQSPPPYYDDPKPRSGIGAIVVGWVGLGVAVAATANMTRCLLFVDAPVLCTVGWGIVLGGGLGVGIPVLKLGYRRRAERKAWEQRRGLARFEGLRIAPHRGGGSLVYSLRF